MRNKTPKTSGFTLIEILVSVGILVVIVLAVGSFQGDVFFIGNSVKDNLNSQIDARNVLRKLIAELRSVSPSSLGAYPIASAGTSTLIFYSNIDADAYKERVRYFLQEKSLKRGVIKPSGSPLVYDTGSESVSNVIQDVANSTSTPIFEYFDKNFTGTSTPLADPVNIPDVRLIRVTVIIDKDTNRAPGPFTATSQGMLRNLKDNL